MYTDDNIIFKKNQDKFSGKEILKDNLTNGKERPWKEKKLKSLELSGSYKRLYLESKFLRVYQCGNFLEFKKFDDGTMKLDNVYFCQTRLCSMCSWRRELKIFSQVSKVITSINKNNDYRFLFLTLTCQNITSDNLKGQIDILFKSFKKMFERKDIKKSVKGWFRALEITHDVNRKITTDMYYGNKLKHLKTKENYYRGLDLNIDDDNPNFNMYHPHFHIILLVNKSYFTDKDYYIKQDSWTDFWKESLQCDYKPIVHIVPFKKNNGKEVSEVSKYTVKDNDFLVKNDLDLTDETVLTLENSLFNRRLVAFGGLLKSEHKKLNLSDIGKDGDLIHIDEHGEIISNEVHFIIERYRWNVGYSNYIKF